MIKERYDPLNHLILLLISHVAARGKAQSVGKQALINAGAVIGRARVERLEVRNTNLDLWPTRVSFFEAPVGWEVNRQLAEEAIAAVVGEAHPDALCAAKRRVRGVLDRSAAGQALKLHLFECAQAVLGSWAKYLAPHHCENRALVIEPGGFISTHKDSREGDLTCVHFLTGSGAGSR